MKKITLLVLLSTTLLAGSGYVVSAEEPYIDASFPEKILGTDDTATSASSTTAEVMTDSSSSSSQNIPSFTGYEAEGLPRELVVGQTGQLKRPADHYLAKTEYSFKITVSDPSILTFNEKGEWQALKSGTVTVYYELADFEKNQNFNDELDRLGIKKQWIVQEVAMEPFTVIVKSNNVAMYRLYNPNSGEHFYTSIAAERDYLKSAGWKYEGVNWHSGGDKPVYRLYNPNAKAGSHHYTLSSSERDNLVRLGWRDEGIGWYATE